MNSKLLLSFTIKSNNLYANYFDKYFKAVFFQGELYAASFSGDLLFKIYYDNVSDDVIDKINNLPNNYAIINKTKKQNDYLVEIYSVSSVKEVNNIEIQKLNIRDNLKAKDTFNNLDVLVVLKNINDLNDKNLYLEGSRNLYFQIKRKREIISTTGEEKHYYLIEDSPKRISNLNNYQSVLLFGKINFTNIKKYISNEDFHKLKQLEFDVKSYLNLWDKYNNLELIQAFDAFKTKGHVRFSTFDYKNNLKIMFDDDSFAKFTKSFSDENMIVIGDKEMLELLKTDDIIKYNEVQRDLFKNGKIIQASFRKRDIDKVFKTLTIRSSEYPFFESQKLVNGGYITLSLLGDEISHKRRQTAKNNIISGQTGMDKLYTFFTDNPEPTKRDLNIDIDHRLLKQHNLTPNQLEAVSLICNTPDIAIIQGPPGTGKTTVIVEALTQLNSQSKNKYDFGNNLLSGFKHETVLNMTENIDLFGLPAVKVGERAEEKDATDIEPRIIAFIEQLKNNLKEKYFDLSVEEEEYLTFQKLYTSYLNFNISIESSIQTLEKIKQLEYFKYNVDIVEKINNQIKTLKKHIDKLTYEEQLFLDLLYILPLNVHAYDDNHLDLLSNLEILSSNNKIKTDVDEVVALLKEDKLDFEKIKDIRRKLILKYKKRPPIITSTKERENVLNLLKDLYNFISLKRLEHIDGDKIALLDYIESLEENPRLIKDTLMEYTKVLGATNQQSLSKDMYDIKSSNMFFDNVFIDEAATSSPLDLFIPMSLAKERIVLVGDHRQLPNIINEDILEKVINDPKLEISVNKEIILDELKQTFFELLMEKAYSLEKQDGIKRVITLNTQFRMHPELGELVSENFYLADGGVKSIRPASDFEHNYNGLTNRHLYWLNVSNTKHEEVRNPGSSSRKRTLEAIKIAKHIKEALDKGDETFNSIGVITIFRDQVTEVKKELYKVGVFDRDFVNQSKYAHIEILIGTVDAFQGREFDIVYLSLTYISNDITRERYPFSRLAGETSDSLLCVALSRQRKMLLVVGDLELYSHELCQEKVPSIYEVVNMTKAGGYYE